MGAGHSGDTYTYKKLTKEEEKACETAATFFGLFFGSCIVVLCILIVFDKISG
jgi:hypothetical protein